MKVTAKTVDTEEVAVGKHMQRAGGGRASEEGILQETKKKQSIRRTEDILTKVKAERRGSLEGSGQTVTSLKKWTRLSEHCLFILSVRRSLVTLSL